ncbi:uncharacterized protein LOC131482095 [Ochotona princeps]|uniref:uncharacterized protein LOC131482095 n=1 Tax=Ochotona princeps TaxID=9978 RepID=UPI0027149F8B|nr:uncharacterized protein LOC131482095 [Ochotona princeps]
MLLPLLGACAVVGPFYGPEWEPVQDLLAHNRNCKDPRCRGNLLILCLFLVWQVQRCWHKVTRTRSCMRTVNKVPPQKGGVSSTRCDTFFRLNPETFILGNSRGLNAHVQQWAHKQRRGSRRSFQKPRPQYLLSQQDSCQGPSWGVCSLSEPTFCTTSFSSTCLVSQDSSWDVPWPLREGKMHPTFDTCQRRERLWAHSQEGVLPMEPVLSITSHPPSMTLAISLPNLPSAQRLQFYPREFLPDLSHRQLGLSIWESWDCLQDAWAPRTKTQTVSREDGREAQAAGWADPREHRAEDAREPQASEDQLPVDLEMEHVEETRILECGNQRLIINEVDGDSRTPEQEKQEQMRAGNGAKTQEPKERIHVGVTGKNLADSQAHGGENQEQFTCQVNAETQTSESGNWGKNGVEDGMETHIFKRDNKKEARREDGESQAQGLGQQGQGRGEDGEDALKPKQEKPEQNSDPGAEVQAEDKRNRDQAGGEGAAQTQAPGRESLGGVRQMDAVESQALKWEKQEYHRCESLTESQMSSGEKPGQARSDEAGRVQASWGEDYTMSKPESRVRWGNQHLGGGEDAGETPMSNRTKLREIRVEDWVVIQAPWWGNQRLVATKTDTKSKDLCCGTQKWIGNEHRTEIQALREHRVCGYENGTNTLTPKAENQGKIRNKTAMEVHPAGQRNQEWSGDENRTEIQALGKRNLKGVKGKDDPDTWELGEENQGLLGNEFNANIDIPEWKIQEHIRRKHGANPRTSEVDNCEEVTHKIDGEAHVAAWHQEEQVRDARGAESQIYVRRDLHEAGGQDGTQSWAPAVGNPNQLRSDIARKTHWSEQENQEQMGGEAGAEIQIPEKRKGREPGGEHDRETQRPERENQGLLDGGSGGSRCPAGRRWGQTAEDQAPERRKQQVPGRNTQKLRGKNQALLRREVNGKPCLLARKNQGCAGGANGAKTPMQGSRNLKATIVHGGTATRAPEEDGQEPFRSGTDGKNQTQGIQNESGDEDTADIQDAGSQSKHRAEDAGQPRAPATGNSDQVGRENPTRAHLESSGGEGPPGGRPRLPQPLDFPGFAYAAVEKKWAEAVNASASAPRAEVQLRPWWGEAFRLAGGVGEHLASLGLAPVGELRDGASPTSRRVQPEPQRRKQGQRGVHLEKASSLAAPAVCLSRLGDRCSLATTVLTDLPMALAMPTKWPVLKKSQRQLLESLMRRRIAHLQWGLPRRILESYLLFSFFGPSSLPLAGVRLSGLGTLPEPHRQQERQPEAQSSRIPIQSPGRSQRLHPPESTSPKLLGQKERPKPMCVPIPPQKPKRSKPPGGTREPQVTPEAPPRPPPPASHNLKPAAEARSWCGPERVPESCREDDRGRKTVRRELSQMAARAPRTRSPWSFWAGHDQGSKEHTPWGSSKLTHWRRGSPVSAEGRGAGHKAALSSTNSFRGGLHAVAARLGTTLLGKMAWSPQLAKPQRSAPNLSLRDPESTSALRPTAADPPAGDSSLRAPTVPAHCCAEDAFPKPKSPWDQGAPENPNGTPWNPLVPQKLGITKHWRDFLFQHGLKKEA